MARIGFDPSVISDASPTFTLGEVLSYQGNLFRYIQVVDLATVNGSLLTYSTATSGFVGTTDRSGGTALAELKPIGVAMGVIAVNQYGFVMVCGTHTAVLSDGAVVAGESVMPHATTDGTMDTMAAGDEDHVFGVALANDTTTAPVSIRLM